MRELARETWRVFVTATATAEIGVVGDEAAVEAAVEAAILIVDLPGTIPGRSHHLPDNLMALGIFVVTDLRLEKRIRTCQQEMPVAVGVRDASDRLLSHVVVLAHRRLAVHLRPDHEGRYDATPQASAVAVVPQNIGIRRGRPIRNEESAGAEMYRPIHEDVHRLQSVEEARVLPPDRGVIDLVHLLDLA